MGTQVLTGSKGTYKNGTDQTTIDFTVSFDTCMESNTIFVNLAGSSTKTQVKMADVKFSSNIKTVDY